jgi:hypothetical protein
MKRFNIDWERAGVVIFLIVGTLCFWYAIYHALFVE